MNLRGNAFYQRKAQIVDKYVPLFAAYRQMEEKVILPAMKEHGLTNFVERNNLPAYQKKSGVSCAMQIVEAATSYKKAVQYVTEQVQETSVSEDFRSGAQLILNDLLSEKVNPIQIANLLG